MPVWGGRPGLERRGAGGSGWPGEETGEGRGPRAKLDRQNGTRLAIGSRCLLRALLLRDESSSSKRLALRNDSPVPEMESYRQQEIGASGQELPIGFYGAENGPQLRFVGRNRDSSAGGVDAVPPVRKLHKGASSF